MDGKIKNEKERKRAKRAGRIRKNIEGTDARPRLTVFRSSTTYWSKDSIWPWSLMPFTR